MCAIFCFRKFSVNSSLKQSLFLAKVQHQVSKKIMIHLFETWQIKFENQKLNSSFKIESFKLKRVLINDRLRFQKYPEVFAFRLI